MPLYMGIDLSPSKLAIVAIDENKILSSKFERVMIDKKDKTLEERLLLTTKQLQASLLEYFGQNVSLNIRRINVAIDYDINSIRWPGRIDSIVLNTMLHGCITRMLLGMGAVPHFIAPSEVRKWLELGARAKKEEVHSACLGENYKSLGMNEDERDAYVLAKYIQVKCELEKIGELK